MTRTSEPTAIRCIRPELTADWVGDIQKMTDLAIRLGYQPGQVVVIDPRREGPYATVIGAIAEHEPAAVIVPDIDHIDGIDHYIRERVLLINTETGVVSERITPEVAV